MEANLHLDSYEFPKTLITKTFQNEEFSPSNATNKLYTQLTIYAKSRGNMAHKETKIPALKKRRSSTSDKPNDINSSEYKKSKILETCDIYNRNNGPQLKLDNPTFCSEIDRKADKELPVLSNGKNQQVISIFVFRFNVFESLVPTWFLLINIVQCPFLY